MIEFVAWDWTFLVGCVVTAFLESAGSGWKLLIQATADSGLVLILRWLRWRVNEWSEISAMIASACSFVLTGFGPGSELLTRLSGGEQVLALPMRLLIVVSITTVAWIAVTIATRSCASTARCGPGDGGAPLLTKPAILRCASERTWRFGSRRASSSSAASSASPSRAGPYSSHW